MYCLRKYPDASSPIYSKVSSSNVRKYPRMWICRMWDIIIKQVVQIIAFSFNIPSISMLHILIVFSIIVVWGKFVVYLNQHSICSDMTMVIYHMATVIVLYLFYTNWWWWGNWRLWCCFHFLSSPVFYVEIFIITLTSIPHLFPRQQSPRARNDMSPL